MLGFPLGILSAAGAGGVAGGDYELISTEILGSNQGSVVFSNLGDYSSTYKHLQIRSVTRSNHPTVYEILLLRFNSDTAGNYSTHNLIGNGATVTSNATTNGDSALGGISSGANNTAYNFSPAVIDILDAYSTTKNKTVRSLNGLIDSNDEIRLSSGVWRNTASTTSLTIAPLGGTQWLTGSRFSLYGIKG